MPASVFTSLANVHITDDFVAHFGDAPTELQATAAESVIAPLSQFRVLRFSGDDAENFLQGQLTCDVKGLRALHATPGGYCTAQGRLLATFLLWREPDAFGMLIRDDIAAAVQRRLQMYVLRAKVKIADESAQRAVLGLSGSHAGAGLTRADIAPPGAPFAMTSAGDRMAIALPGGRYLVSIAAEELERAWSSFAATLKPVGSSCWDWLDVINGMPWITAATQEQFVPQMVNLEIIGGVNFQKGCYPGQEVVARTQYRAKTRRRMHLAHVAVEAKPGMELYAASLGDQASGTVVSAAPAPEGGWDVLAVLHPEALAAPIQLGALGGPALSLRDLPYRVE